MVVLAGGNPLFEHGILEWELLETWAGVTREDLGGGCADKMAEIRGNRDFLITRWEKQRAECPESLVFLPNGGC